MQGNDQVPTQAEILYPFSAAAELSPCRGVFFLQSLLRYSMMFRFRVCLYLQP